ncbi:putative membrane protein [Acinetobacter baumannii 1406589]|uniref:hypothetical protein n=1 Tax=Acinetobacter baumannii TaxID=470 RepID=UPI000451E385|nr:hypothetical protein [Acinetobacter baumannii]EXS50219.1 putative membrane protein [Acinetobacter baumannii 1406589]MDC4147544.1 hypothetical protein [Acinetobacter baumannii]
MKKIIIGLYLFINMVVFFYVIFSSINSRNQAVILIALGLINLGILELSELLARRKAKEEKAKNL